MKLKNKNNNMHIPRKLKYIIHLIIQFGGAIFLGWYFDRLINMLITIPLFFIFRRKYDKTYHARCINECTIQTLFMLFIVTKLNVDIGLSIMLTIIITYIDTEILYHIQDYIDLKEIVKKINEKKALTKKERILAVVENNEIKIEKFCKKLGVPELSETVYLFLNNTTEVTAEYLGIDSSTVKRRINKFIKISKA